MHINKHEAETLVRLAATVIDEAKDIPQVWTDPIFSALNSFGEYDEVEALARRVAQALYHDGEDLVIS